MTKVMTYHDDRRDLVGRSESCQSVMEQTGRNNCLPFILVQF